MFRDAARYVVLFAIIFWTVFFVFTFVVTVGPAVQAAVSANSWIWPTAGAIALVMVLVEILDDIRVARR